MFLFGNCTANSSTCVSPILETSDMSTEPYKLSSSTCKFIVVGYLLDALFKSLVINAFLDASSIESGLLM